MLTRRSSALASFPYTPTGNEFWSASPNLIGLDTLRADWFTYTTGGEILSKREGTQFQSHLFSISCCVQGTKPSFNYHARRRSSARYETIRSAATNCRFCMFCCMARRYTKSKSYVLYLCGKHVHLPMWLISQTVRGIYINHHDI